MRPHTVRTGWLIVAVSLFTGLLLDGLASPAGAIPAFARRYRQSCNFCHAPFPRLTDMGAMVASHGFRMAPGETPPGTMEAADTLLTLPDQLPLAIRVDGYFRVHDDRDETMTDFQSPWVMKLLSSAPLGKDFSYYFYFLLNERGDVAGAEDAFLYWNDIGGRPIDLAVGQFQVSDPLFKRELRLPVDDYMVYKVEVGDQSATLAYERGAMLIAERGPTRLTLQLLNGNGIPGATDARYDDDRSKNVFAHLSHELMPALRLGAIGYSGHQRAATGQHARLWMAGLDATVSAAPLEVNLQYVHREDDHATFTTGEPWTITDGGFAEVLLLPEGSRAYGYVLYNRVEANRPLLKFGTGYPNGTARYETVSAGVGYLVQRNLRIYGEAIYDTEQETSRLTLGFTTAY